MRLLCFDPLRTLELPGVRYLKPELMFRHREELLAADWVLFPQHWQVNALLYGLRRRIFPSANSYHLGHDKIEMTRAFWAACPEHVPQTLILPATPTAVEEILDTLAFPLVAKEPRSSMGRGVHLIQDPAALKAYAARHDILYVQEQLPIDRDLRVVWVGDRVVTAYWRIAPEGGFHNNLALGARMSFEGIPAGVPALVERVARALGLDHAGFDVAVVDGHPYLLEFNTLFGNEALRIRGIRLGEVILDYLRRRGSAPQDPPTPLARSA